MQSELGPKAAWVDFARNADPLYTMDKILTGVGTAENFQPDLRVLKAFGLPADEPLRVVDFGAGMLRNTVGLLEMSPSWHVEAYDCPEMIERGMRHFRDRIQPHFSRFSCVTEFEKLGNRYDAVIALLCFQHIEPGPLRTILGHLTAVTDRLCVFGRRSLDDVESDSWTPVWPIILERFKPVGAIFKGEPCAGDLYGGARHDHLGAIFEGLR